MREPDQEPVRIDAPPRESAGEHENHTARRDALIGDYRAILAELALLTTVSVLLFGFLLTNSDSAASASEEWMFALAMVLVASATMVFVLPVAYHHVQFPYEDFDKFQMRSHRWILVGLPLLGTGLYLSLCLALWSLFDAGSLVIASLPMLAAAVVFILRKGQL
jgi:hypothetical protein